MKTNEQNKTTKLLLISTPLSLSSSISYNNMWTASPRLLKSLLKEAQCNLKKLDCYLKAFYCNGLYFTLSPEVFPMCGGSPSLMFEKKLKMAENENLSHSMEGMR